LVNERQAAPDQLERATRGQFLLEALFVVVVGIDATDKRTDLQRQPAPVRPEEGTVAVVPTLEDAASAVGPEDVAHPGRVGVVSGVDRVARGAELVEIVAAGVGGDAIHIARRHVDFAGLAARLHVPSAADAEELGLYQLHREHSWKK